MDLHLSMGYLDIFLNYFEDLGSCQRCAKDSRNSSCNHPASTRWFVSYHIIIIIALIFLLGAIYFLFVGSL
jgi:hypothetical protein